MGLLRKIYPIVIILFAWSVCVAMYNLVGEENVMLFGISREYYLLPLFLVNCLTIVLSFNSIMHSKGQTTIVLLWMLFIVLFYLMFFNFKFRELIELTLWPTSYLSSYILVKRTPKYFDYYKWFFLAVFALGFYYFMNGKMLQVGLNSLGLSSSSNAVFCVLTVFPFMMFFKKKSITYLAFFITLVAVVFSNKRSAFIILALASLPTIWASVSSIRSRFSRLIVLFSLIVVGLLSFTYMSNEYLDGRIIERFQSINEDEGSGRKGMWLLVMSKLSSSDFGELLVGHGHMAVARLGEASASHNDFLDVLYDYGIVLFIIYLCLHYYLISRTIYLYRNGSPLFAPYFFTFVVFVVMSWISILVVQTRYLIYIAIFWGAIEALTETNYSLNKNSVNFDNQ